LNKGRMTGKSTRIQRMTATLHSNEHQRTKKDGDTEEGWHKPYSRRLL